MWLALQTTVSRTRRCRHDLTVPGARRARGDRPERLNAGPSGPERVLTSLRLSSTGPRAPGRSGHMSHLHAPTAASGTQSALDTRRARSPPAARDAISQAAWRPVLTVELGTEFHPSVSAEAPNGGGLDQSDVSSSLRGAVRGRHSGSRRSRGYVHHGLSPPNTRLRGTRWLPGLPSGACRPEGRDGGASSLGDTSACTPLVNAVTRISSCKGA